MVACNKINRPGDWLGFRSANQELPFLSRISFVVFAALGSLLTYLNLFIMREQQVKSNIVYDPANDRTWNMQEFFETLELYYEGKPELMAEDLVNAIKTLLLGSNDIISDAVIETSLHLFYVRDAVMGIEINQTP